MTLNERCAKFLANDMEELMAEPPGESRWLAKVELLKNFADGKARYDRETVAQVTPWDYITAARVPDTVESAEFGLWQISRRDFRAHDLCRALCGFDTQTVLTKFTQATIHLGAGEIVMEDSAVELMRHLPIWMAARGRVLVTGLGLGCVVRGLLASERVDHVTVIEKDCQIIERIGPEFWSNPRVSLYLEDALMWEPAPGERFDWAWHDLFTDQGAGEPHLQRLHAKLFMRYRETVRVQGAWAFPRDLWRIYASRLRLIGGPKFRQQKPWRPSTVQDGGSDPIDVRGRQDRKFP